ncbi:MAG: YceI family protein [Bacteroidetes bacterium HGW-Bacteroidetes-12]|jgi:polyisoprenoid-binding protein YceI|nr:MAG: YceI family protein [Bacteroidetes bacterium HGW-Bacteroidetes-12]
MKKIFLSIAVVALTTLSFTTVKHDDDSHLHINKELSSLEWIGKKVSGQHAGTITIKEGSVKVEKGLVTGGEIVIDMTSILVTDLEGEYKGKLEGHLNSPDFFDTKNHEIAILKINSTKKTKGSIFNVKADLTIKGITKAIEFPATIEVKEGKLAAYAEVNIDRTQYDIKYGSGKFFEGLGDKMIDDLFVVKFKIAANN